MSYDFHHSTPSWPMRLRELHWPFLLLVLLAGGVGVVALYAAAGGALMPWAGNHLVRLILGFVLLLVVALVDIRIWMQLAYPIYALCLLSLLAVELMGVIGMGAQRWISIMGFQLQPSEFMKIALLMAMARYFHQATLDDMGRITFLLPPLLLAVIPTALVLAQPNLGTALILLMLAGTLFWMAGARWWKFAGIIAAAIAAVPVIWHFMHDYQQRRVLTFLNPEADPLGAGYHIMQSKIALGAGGLSGKGFLQGTQGMLDFLPEKQTDFIFTLLAEEWGLLGAASLLLLFSLMLLLGWLIAARSRSQFGRLLAVGITVNFSLYIFINVAMVSGLIPVVGIPLPLISYGGSSSLAVMIGFGLLQSIYLSNDHRLR